MATETDKKPRKSPARPCAVVLAAIEERMLIIDEVKSIEELHAHTARVRDLTDELVRSVNNVTKGADSEL